MLNTNTKDKFVFITMHYKTTVILYAILGCSVQCNMISKNFFFKLTNFAFFRVGEWKLLKGTTYSGNDSALCFL
jgi:hypothetical protein